MLQKFTDKYDCFYAYVQVFSKTASSVKCRWCCLPPWFGLWTACLSLHPRTMNRKKSCRKPRGISKVSPRNSSSSLTAARLSLDTTTLSRFCSLLIFIPKYHFESAATLCSQAFMISLSYASLETVDKQYIHSHSGTFKVGLGHIILFIILVKNLPRKIKYIMIY